MRQRTSRALLQCGCGQPVPIERRNSWNFLLPPTANRNFLDNCTVSHTVYAIHHMSPGTVQSESFDNLRLELRRGCLVLAVMLALRKEQYGYTLRRELALRSIEIDESTLYPLLRRLESQGLLTSVWREEEKRNKRFYRLSAEGKNILKQLQAEWQSINASLEGLL